MEYEKKRYASLDLLRAMAIIAVVIIHNLPNVDRKMLNVCQQTCTAVVHAMLNWGVPVFAMITGALILPKDEGILKTLKRVRRIVLVLLTFGLLMAFIQEYFESGLIFKSFFASAADVLSGKTWDVMWYMYMIAGIYLFMPFIRLFVKNADDRTIWYILILLFAFNSVIRTLNRLNPSTAVGFYLPCESIFLFYVICGYFLFNRCKNVSRIIPAICAVCAVICYIFLALKTDFNADSHTYAEYYSPSSPINVILSVSVFVLIKDCMFEKRIITKIAENSFGIYVIHCFYIHFINIVLNIYPENYPMYISVPVLSAVVFLLSLFSSQLLRKITFVKKYIL